MKKEDLELKNEKKESHRYQTLGMSLGMCFGISIGMSVGSLLFDNGSIGMCMGLSIGMLLGMMIGMSKDKAINEQLKTKGYKILEIFPKDVSLKEYEVKIIDKNEEIHLVTVSKGDMETEKFEVGDFVYMDEEGSIEQAIDKEETTEE